MARKSTKVHTRTVTKELHEAWLKLKRKGDPEKMAAQLGYSRPVIDRALLYGNVLMGELPDAINKFFQERIQAERATAKKMLQDMAVQEKEAAK